MRSVKLKASLIATLSVGWLVGWSVTIERVTIERFFTITQVLLVGLVPKLVWKLTLMMGTR